MSWKPPVRLLSAIFFASFAAVPVFAPPVQQMPFDLQLGIADYSSQHFSNLSADEINRRTLKAAAAIKSATR